MSKKLFTFLLSELKMVRVVCKHEKCGVVMEMTAERMGQQFGYTENRCPHCREYWTSQAGREGNVFSQLAFAVKEAQRTDAKFDIEFVLTDTASG